MLFEEFFFSSRYNFWRYHGGTAADIRKKRAICFEDNGSGIADAEKEKIFERGFGKNTGLGLFLAREILSITGITIRETGTPGTGARFEILVPRGVPVQRPGCLAPGAALLWHFPAGVI
ncbi:MAG: ATP-binding protein [Methanoregula sp.]